jgi:hypothetical protein
MRAARLSFAITTLPLGRHGIVSPSANNLGGAVPFGSKFTY